MPVDYTANWKKIESERKGGSEGGYYKGREREREKGAEGGMEGETKGVSGEGITKRGRV